MQLDEKCDEFKPLDRDNWARLIDHGNRKGPTRPNPPDRHDRTRRDISGIIGH